MRKRFFSVLSSVVIVAAFAALALSAGAEWIGPAI